MSLFSPAFRFRAMLVLAGALALAARPAHAAEDDTRFSALLRPEQWNETGLNKLTTDNIAVIDALVRVDKTASEYRNSKIGTTRFSQRRTEHERTISGLYLLTPEQLQRLDDLVAVRVARPPAQFETALPTPQLVFEPVTTAERPNPIHGSFTLTYGWGKGGSFRGGDAVMSYEDPAHRFSVLFGYSEYHGKGYSPLLYPDDGLYRYRPAPDVFLPER